MLFSHKQPIAFAVLSIAILVTACKKKDATSPQPVANSGTQYVITTIAGNGASGYSGDGAAATAANLNEPTGLVTDAAGNIYISDKFNNCIRKVNTAGIITTAAGNGTAGFTGDGGAATNAELNNPYGIAIDPHGNIYIADYKNARVRVLGNSGNITTIAGNGINGYSGDGGAATAAEIAPIAVAVDDSGYIYIADADNNRIRKIVNGIITTFAGNGAANYFGDGGLADTSALYYPAGLTCDHMGNVYIADYNN
ncbi:MAG TPA: SBBP repeat-containing protein, partial [Bacteroidia bacterium]|nr:SBBP repeat-containing protein [Bacteroidia bacterium]